MFKKIKKLFVLILLLFFQNLKPNFSKSYSNFISDNEIDINQNEYVWQVDNSENFNELIMSWNAFRPTTGKYSFYVSVKHNYWTSWDKIAEWGKKSQQTFSKKKDNYASTKYVRVVLKKHKKASGFRIKVIAEKGAKLLDLKALFVCLSKLDNFKITKYKENLPSTLIKGVPKQSQIVLNHPRCRELCSPTSVSMIVNYFLKNYYNIDYYTTNFAKKVLDDQLGIYGNWLLNVAQAYDSSNGNVFFRVERLNSFEDLYKYIADKTPVAVSVRGHLKGGAKTYSAGHFMVVVGWNNIKKAVLCIDPAFPDNKSTLRAYHLKDFLHAWGISHNLSYVAIPKFKIF